MPEQQKEIDTSPTAVFAAIERASELWGGQWQEDRHGGTILLPVVQGLRRGAVSGRIDLEPVAAGTLLSFDVEDLHLELHRSAVFVLSLGALGGLSVVFWPLSPSILAVAPLGVVLAIAAWLMVVSRLRNSGVEDFLDLVAELAEQGESRSGVAQPE